MKKINIYSIDIYNNYIYEFSCLTKLNCRQKVIKSVINMTSINNIKSHNKNYIWLNKIINHHSLKGKNIIGFKASYI